MAEKPWPEPKFSIIIPANEPGEDEWYVEYPIQPYDVYVAATRRADKVQRPQKIHEHTKDVMCVADKFGRPRYSHRIITPLQRGEDG